MEPINIIPKPAKMLPGEGKFEITPSTTICASPGAWNVGSHLQELLHCRW